MFPYIYTDTVPDVGAYTNEYMYVMVIRMEPLPVSPTVHLIGAPTRRVVHDAITTRVRST